MRSKRALSQPAIARRAVIRAVLRWYAHRRRRLPWRSTFDPYRILVSEVMLQQTNVGRVTQKYAKFLRRFPTLRVLSAAAQKEVVIAWDGLGYNNRAVRLHQAARRIVAEHSGRVPSNFASLTALPGVGKYTAHAILSFAFRAPVPVVDVNVRRVLSRLVQAQRSTGAVCADDAAWVLAGELLPVESAYEWNQALMDLGATVCTRRAPRCSACPVSALCASRAVMKRTLSRQPRQEPSLEGIPNRIYRGRIIRLLRQGHGRRKLHLDAVGKRIHERYGHNHRRWLDALLRRLEKDGLIRVECRTSGARKRVGLA